MGIVPALEASDIVVEVTDSGLMGSLKWTRTVALIADAGAPFHGAIAQIAGAVPSADVRHRSRSSCHVRRVLQVTQPVGEVRVVVVVDGERLRRREPYRAVAVAERQRPCDGQVRSVTHEDVRGRDRRRRSGSLNSMSITALVGFPLEPCVGLVRTSVGPCTVAFGATVNDPL